MPTIIPCVHIQAAIEELQAKFEPCYVLQAGDLDQILDIIYSVSLCEGADLVQDNVFEIIVPNTVNTTDASYTVADIVSAINASPGFTVSDTELTIFEVRIVETVSDVVTFKTAYYLLKSTQTGTYGSGTLTEDNLFFLRDTITFSSGTSNTNPPVVYEARTETAIDVDSPHTVVNAATGPYAIAANTDYYFRIIVTSGGLDTSTYKLYRWIGATGSSYGTAGGGTAISGDFLLVEESDTQVTQNQILVTVYNTGYTMDDTEDISDAVNSSFRGAINIGTNELVCFIALRYIIGFDNIVSFLEERYFYVNGGPNIINADSVITDFSLYEKETVLNVTTPLSGTPEVKNIFGDDLDQPEDGVNDSAETYVIDGTKDFYFAMYLNDPGPAGASYKLYRWTGANGTYGSGGTTAVNGDFTLLYEQGTVEGPQFYKFEPDPYLGDRYDFVDTGVNGFYLGRSVNERTGVDVWNDSTGAAATCGFIASATQTPFNSSVSLQYFGVNYFGVPMRDKGGLYASTSNGMLFVGGNAAPFQFYSLPDTDLAGMNSTPVLDMESTSFTWRQQRTTIAAIDAIKGSQPRTIPTVEWVEAQISSRTTVSISASEIENIGTTPIELIAAPGAGIQIAIESIFYQYDHNTVSFDNNDLDLDIGGTPAQLIPGSVISGTSDVFDKASLTSGMYTFAGNQPATLTGTDSVAVGDGTLKLYITHKEITL